MGDSKKFLLGIDAEHIYLSEDLEEVSNSQKSEVNHQLQPLFSLKQVKEYSLAENTTLRLKVSDQNVTHTSTYIVQSKQAFQIYNKLNYLITRFNRY